MSNLDLNWGQRLMISRGFYIALGKQTRPGWNGSLMFYAFKCKKHGIVSTYVSGTRTLRCPKCSFEIKLAHKKVEEKE